ncbi:hypothetical protein [Paenibacillus sp. GYB003]
MEKEMLRTEMAKAANDPLFMEDLQDSMESSGDADKESAKENSEW